MSDTTPNVQFEQDEDTSGHSARAISDPGEVPTEGGRGQLPMPGDEDDTRGHEEVLTSDATEGFSRS